MHGTFASGTCVCTSASQHSVVGGLGVRPLGSVRKVVGTTSTRLPYALVPIDGLQRHGYSLRDPVEPPSGLFERGYGKWVNGARAGLFYLFSHKGVSDIRRVNTAGQHRGRKYPPTPSCVVLTQAQHGPEKYPPTPFVHPMATQEAEDFVLCCVVLCCVVLCCVVLCCVVLCWVGLGWVGLCCVVLCCVVLCCVTTEHNTTQHNKIKKKNTAQNDTRKKPKTKQGMTQHNTTQHNITQHNTT